MVGAWGMWCMGVSRPSLGRWVGRCAAIMAGASRLISREGWFGWGIVIVVVVVVVQLVCTIYVMLCYVWKELNPVPRSAITIAIGDFSYIYVLVSFNFPVLVTTIYIFFFLDWNRYRERKFSFFVSHAHLFTHTLHVTYRRRYITGIVYARCVSFTKGTGKLYIHLQLRY